MGSIAPASAILRSLRSDLCTSFAANLYRRKRYLDEESNSSMKEERMTPNPTGYFWRGPIVSTQQAKLIIRVSSWALFIILIWILLKRMLIHSRGDLVAQEADLLVLALTGTMGAFLWIKRSRVAAWAFLLIWAWLGVRSCEMLFLAGSQFDRDGIFLWQGGLSVTAVAIGGWVAWRAVMATRAFPRLVQPELFD